MWELNGIVGKGDAPPHIEVAGRCRGVAECFLK